MARNSDFFGKLADGEDDGLVFQRTILLPSSVLERERNVAACYKLLGRESFVLAAVCIGLITMFLKTSNRTNVILCSATFYLCMNGKMLPL